MRPTLALSFSAIALLSAGCLPTVRTSAVIQSPKASESLGFSRFQPISEVVMEGRGVIFKEDTLWSISKTLYGDPFLWPVLCWKNQLRDCDKIFPGQIISYPPNLSPALAETARQFSHRYRGKKGRNSR